MYSADSGGLTAHAYTTFLIDVSADAYNSNADLDLSIDDTTYLSGAAIDAAHDVSEEEQYTVNAPVSGSVATIDGYLTQESSNPSTGAVSDLYIDSVSANGSLSILNIVQTPVAATNFSVPVSSTPGIYQTNNGYLPLYGAAVAGQTVDAYVQVGSSQTLIGSAVADAQGDWTIVPTTPLSVGDNTVVIETGSSPIPPSEEVTLTIDVSGPAPAAPTITSFSAEPIYLASNPDLTLSGTGAPNLEILLYQATVSGSEICATTFANSQGLWSISLSGVVVVGINQLTAQSVDSSGQISSSSQPYIIDYEPAPVANPSLTVSDAVSQITVSSQSAVYCFNGVTITDPGSPGPITISISDSLTTMGILVDETTGTAYSYENPAVFTGSLAAAQTWLSEIEFQPSNGAYGDTRLSVAVSDAISTETTSIGVVANTSSFNLVAGAVVSGSASQPFGGLSIVQALNAPVVFAGGIDNIATDANPANTAVLQSTGRASLQIQSVGLRVSSNDAATSPSAGVITTTNAASSQLPAVIQNFAPSGSGIIELFLTNTSTIPEADWNEPTGNSPWQAEIHALNWQPNEATLDLNTGETGYITTQDMTDALALEAVAQANGINLVLPIITPNGSDLRGNPATDPAWANATTLMNEMGGVAIDLSPSNFLVHGATEADVLAYQQTVEELIQYANTNGLASVVMLSPYNESDASMPVGWVPQFWADPDFLASTQEVVSMLENAGALPQQWIVENYGLSGNETQVGSDLDQESVNGVATWLAQYAPVSTASALLNGLSTPLGPTFTATVSLSSGAGATLVSATGVLSKGATAITFTGSASAVQQDIQNLAVKVPSNQSGPVPATITLTDGGYSTQQTVNLQVIDGYQFASGQLTIINGSPTNNVATGTLVLAAGLTPANLWFFRSGNDLQIEVLGSSSVVGVQGWFSNAYSQLASLQLSDGSSITSAKMTALANAASAYQTRNPTFNPQVATQMPSDGTLRSALNTDWSRTIVGNVAGGVLSGVYGNDTLTATGNNTTINAGSGIDQINLNGTDDSVAPIGGTGTVVDNDVYGDSVTLASNASATINGDGGAVDINGTNVTVFASREAITTTGGAVFGLTGNYNTIDLGALGYVGMSGGSGNLVTDDNAGMSVNLMTNTSSIIEGSGGYIGICGTNVMVTASNESFATVASAAFTLIGNNNTISLSALSYLGLNGGSGNVVNNDVAGVSVNLTTGTSATVNGSGGSIGIYGTGITLTASNEGFATLTSAAFSLTGSSDTISLSPLSSVTLNGGAGNVVNNDVAGDAVNLATNSSATINGSGGAVDINGTNITVFASSEAITTTVSAVFGLTGNNNTIDLGALGYVGVSSGSGNVVTDDNAGMSVNLMTNTSSIIEGSGGYIGICGTNVTVTASNESVATVTAAAFKMNGNNDTVNLAPNTSLQASGSGTVIVGSTNDSLIESGTNYVNTLGAGSTVSGTSANSSLTVNGNSLTVTAAAGDTIMQSGTAHTDNLGSGTSLTETTAKATDTINGSSLTVNTETRDNVTVAGSNDTLTLGKSNTVHLVGGTGNSYVVNGSSETVKVDAGVSASFNGTGESITVGNGVGTPTTISALAGSSTVAGGNGGMTFLQGAATSVVTLGTGAATFDFVQGAAGGSVSIYDFVPGLDIVHLSGYQGSGITSETYSGGATRIVLTDHSQITLFGVTLGQHIFG